MIYRLFAKWTSVPVYMISCLLFYYAIPEQNNTLIRLLRLQRTTFPPTAASSFFNYKANTFKGSVSLNLGARPFCVHVLLNNSPWYVAHLFFICKNLKAIWWKLSEILQLKNKVEKNNKNDLPLKSVQVLSLETEDLN